MAVSVADILGPSVKRTASSLRQIPKDLNTDEQKIYKLLQNEVLEVDELAVKLEVGVVEIGTALSIMAIKGSVTESGGKYFVN